jgi:anaerobic magnesium-protoporphyrin IX monomethyl ester cyclase
MEELKNRKITFVNPSAGFCPGLMPLGLGSLSAYLKKHGFNNIRFLDANNENIETKYTDSDIVGITAVTQNMAMATRYAKWLKKKQPNVVIILGGVHVTTAKELPEPFDIGVIGEGEVTLLELVSLPEFTPEALANVKGVCYRQDGQLVFTPPRPWLKTWMNFQCLTEI